MNRAFIFIALLLVGLIVFSCAGEDKKDKDTTPPYPPTMIPHLGDTGDAQTTYYGQPQDITDDNNGIDTVPDGDWIRISWKPFIDEDVNRVRIWRYDEINTVPILIDSIYNPTQRHYLDSTDLTERLWYSYYIDVTDFSGNTSVSDTVSYALLPKPVLLEPLNNAIVPRVGLKTVWSDNGFASIYRFLLFDENHDYVWHHDLFTAMEDNMFVNIPVTFLSSGHSYYWRVDSFDRDEQRQAYLGAEAQEMVFHVQ